LALSRRVLSQSNLELVVEDIDEAGVRVTKIITPDGAEHTPEEYAATFTIPDVPPPVEEPSGHRIPLSLILSALALVIAVISLLWRI
jgi:hypothetical protein